MLRMLSAGMFCSASWKSKLTFDEFFNDTDSISLSLPSDDGESIIIRIRHRILDQSKDEYEGEGANGC